MARDGSPKKRKKDSADASGPSQTSRKRRATYLTNANQSAVPTFYQEYCELPFTLSTILVDEYDCITRKDFDSPRSLHVLPARVTVKQVLQHYQRKRSSKDSQSDDDETKKQHNEKIRRFCESLCLLFDDALPVCLLYREERPQYEALQKDESLKLKRPCEIYGSTFLLRLLQRLPILIKAEPRKEMDELGPLIADLVVLLQKNKQACFGKDSYREPQHHELLSWEKEAMVSCEKKSSSIQ